MSKMYFEPTYTQLFFDNKISFISKDNIKFVCLSDLAHVLGLKNPIQSFKPIKSMRNCTKFNVLTPGGIQAKVFITVGAAAQLISKSRKNSALKDKFLDEINDSLLYKSYFLALLEDELPTPRDITTDMKNMLAFIKNEKRVYPSIVEVHFKFTSDYCRALIDGAIEAKRITKLPSGELAWGKP
jgi:hypothetical protein